LTGTPKGARRKAVGRGHGPIRVGIDATPLLPEPTGVDSFIRGLLSHLARAPHDHEITVFANAEDRPTFERRVVERFRVVPAARRPRPVRLLFQQALLPVAARALDLDVVHSPSFLMPVARGHQRHLLTVHDMTFFSMPHMHNRLRRSRPFRRAVLNSIKRADCVHVPSEAALEEVLSIVPEVGRDRISVIPHGIGDSFGPRSEEEVSDVRTRLGLPPAYILHVGTLQPRKNVARLLEAYEQLLVEGGIDGDLVLAGRTGWQSESVEARLEAPALRGRVHRIGYVTDADLPCLYAGARLFVYPSLHEGFGLPPLEAMACGTPTVASRVPALAENLNGAAELIDPLDVPGLAAAMRRLLVDPKLADRRRSAGIERARRFGWGETTRRMLACYEELAAQ
jgi:glycosyltransferase involved in cell wall biosynthesis